MRLAAVALAIVVLAGCGGGERRLTVYAAASLTEVFQTLDPDARFNFAGSDELATQLREGGRADVYAAASPKYPDELYKDGVLDRPRVFASNRLVLVVPADNPADIHSVADVDRAGVKLVVGQEGVPIGDYTRQVLAKAGLEDVLRRVVSEEKDVKGVVGKVALGEADAGFVYATDAKAAGGEVKTVELPLKAQADVRYRIAVVRGTHHRAKADEFIRLVLSEKGRKALRDAGFLMP
jgi:molybdate transport system substrate-binding protein